MSKKLIITGAFFGAMGVVLGALGAHSLKGIPSPDLLNSFETGVRYQIIHALLLLILGFQNKIKTRVLSFLIPAGIILFSFSIYLLSFRDLLDAGWLKILGPITPIGGLLLISSWILIIITTLRHKN